MAELSALWKARFKREEFEQYLINERKFPKQEASVLTGIKVQTTPLALVVYAIWDPGRVDSLRAVDLNQMGDWDADVEKYVNHEPSKRKFAMTSGESSSFNMEEREMYDIHAIAFLRYGNYEVK